MTNTSTAGAVIAVALLAAAAATGAPPKVVKAAPDNGATGIDPDAKEIRVTFDQPMAQGMSVVGGGEKFPEADGKPRWVDPATIVVPVKLKPNHDYWLSINNDRFQNFTNQAGEPATPYPIKFRTGAAKSGAKARKSDAAKSEGAESSIAKANRRAVELLQSDIRDHYSYRDRLHLDWDAVFKSSEESLVGAGTPKEFAELAGTMLARAEDKHIWLQVGDETIPSFVRPSVPNANYKLLADLVPNFKKHGSAVASGRWDDGIGYVAIAAWDRGKLEEGKSAFDALDGVQDTHALIIDVRLNSGGDEPLAQTFAGCFVGERKLYGKDVYRDAKSPSGYTSPKGRWLEPNASRPRYNGRVVVLSGPAVMSSCESFLLMMKCAPDAVIIGGTSQGSSGNPQPFDLGNGVAVMLPSWKDMTRDGKEFEGVGISPDVEVATSPNDFKSADPVLAAALARLRGEHGK